MANNVRPVKYKLSNLKQVIIEGSSAAWAYVLEGFREDLVHPTVGFYAGSRRRNNEQHPHPTLTHQSDPALYSIVNHLGDWFEGYWLSYTTYWGLTFLFPKMSERKRLVVSATVSSLIVGLWESGLIHNEQPDYYDIPAVALGALAYIGVHKLLNKL